MKKTVLLLGLLLSVGSSLWADDLLSVSEFTIVPGETATVDISLTNEQTWSAFQFTLTLPEGLSVATKTNGDLRFTPTERLNNSYYDDDLEKDVDKYHDVNSNQLANGSYSVLVNSGTSLDIKGSSGAVLKVRILADANVTAGPKKVVLSSMKLTDSTGERAYVQSDTEFDCTVTGTIASGIEQTATGITVVDGATMGQIPSTITSVDLTYTRELTLSGTEAEMYTVCLPYDPPTGDNLTYYTLSTVSGTTLSFDEVALPVAYTPYLVVASATSSVGTTTAQSVDLSTGVTGATATGGEYELCGTLRGMTNAAAAAGGDIYILQDDGTWHKVTTENTDAYIPPFRAYIVKQGGGGNARLRSALGGTTRIGDRVSEGTTDDWYDLQGRKMTGFDKQKSLHRLPKGVYVRKEQKIIIP